MLAPVLVAASTAYPVTLDEAKLHLRVDGDDEDTLISSLIAATTGHLDGPSGILGRFIMPQTWSQEYSAVLGDLVLPLGPVQSATIVGFTGFRLLQDGRGFFLRLNDGASWPESTITVEFVAGYNEAPTPLKAAILLHIGTLYENRETLADKVNHTRAYDALIAPYRVWRG